MSELNITGTKNTPAIIYDVVQKRFSMIGVSVPENANEFFAPLIQAVFRAGTMPIQGTVFHFRLNYFNSSSLKAIYLFLNEVKAGMEAGLEYTIEWCVEEDDEFMSEAAETFSELLGVPLKVLPIV